MRKRGSARRAAACAAVLIAAGLPAACRMDTEERRALLESAQRMNYEIARDTVVLDMRSPSDTGRLVYDSAVSLSERSAPAAGARQMWAPFGISQPDSAPPGATRSSPARDSAALGTVR